MHGDDQAIHLAGNRIGIFRRDGTDVVKVYTNVTLSGRCTRNGNPRSNTFRRRGSRFLGFLAMVQIQQERHRDNQEQQDPHDDMQTRMSGTKAGVDGRS